MVSNGTDSLAAPLVVAAVLVAPDEFESLLLLVAGAGAGAVPGVGAVAGDGAGAGLVELPLLFAVVLLDPLARSTPMASTAKIRRKERAMAASYHDCFLSGRWEAFGVCSNRRW